jgi:transposase
MKLLSMFNQVWMPYRHISNDVCECCFILVAQGWVPLDVCDVFGFSEQSYWHWKRNLDTHGSFLPPKNYACGRPRTLTPSITNDVVDLVNEAPELFLDEIQEWIAIVHDVGILKSALHTILQDYSLTYKLLQKAAAERDEEAWKLYLEHQRP